MKKDSRSLRIIIHSQNVANGGNAYYSARYINWCFSKNKMFLHKTSLIYLIECVVRVMSIYYFVLQ